MGREFEPKDILNNISYRYAWKFAELITLIILIRILDIRELGIAFFSMTLVYFVRACAKLNYKESGTEKIKGFYNALSLAMPIIGIILAGIIYIIASLINAGALAESLKFTSILIMFSFFSLIPEIFYKNRNEFDKTYRSYFFSQIFMAVLTIILALKGLGYQAVLYGYIFFYIINTILLWGKFPFTLKPKIGKYGLNEVYSVFKSTFKVSFLSAILKYGVLIFSAVIFGFINFAYLFMAYFFGFLLYENFTLFLMKVLLPFFRKLSENQELFKFNLVRIIEYISFFIMPFSLITIILSKEIIIKIMGTAWTGSLESFIFLLFAGLIKSIFEITRIIFLVKEKENIISRIKLFELVVLVISFILFTRFFSFNGVGLSILLASVVSSIFYVLIASRFTKINMIAISRDYFYIFFSGILTALIIGLLKEYLLIDSLGSIIAMYFFGVVIYLILTFAFNKDLYKRFIKLFFGEE
jgi:O-antigen/teichoic acid export membrane protein